MPGSSDEADKSVTEGKEDFQTAVRWAYEIATPHTMLDILIEVDSAALAQLRLLCVPRLKKGLLDFRRLYRRRKESHAPRCH